MNMKCDKCEGRGYVQVENQCHTCSGSGKAKSFDPKVTAELSAEQMEMFTKGLCGVCRGSGVLLRTEVCKTCNGSGKMAKCRICGTSIPGGDLCQQCRKKPHAYQLKNSCGMEELEPNKVYVGTVTSVSPVGGFVNLNKRVRGLIPKRNSGKLNLSDGEEVVVKVSRIRPNGEVDLELNPMNDYQVVEVSKEAPVVEISEMEGYVGKLAEIRGKVNHLKVTGGPTIFTLLDESSIVNAAAFEDGERAYPEIDVGDFVRVVGIVKRRQASLQIEIFEMERLLGEEAHKISSRIQQELEERCRPTRTEFLMESEVLEKLRPEMEEVARELRKAVYETRPIIVRHHWDADGIVSGVALEKALKNFIERIGYSDMQFLVKRKVSRAPFYELEDVVKDLSESLEDAEKFGDKMPLVVLTDNGSGMEDIPAIDQFLTFGAEVITVDHHYPDDAVDSYLIHHVNPYKVGGDSNHNAGVLCVEIARMVDELPNPQFMTAVSVVGDRSTGEVEKCIEISGADIEELKKTALALEYEAFYLRFRAASQIIHEILGFGRKDRQKKLIDILSGYARTDIESQVETAMEGVKVQKLGNGVALAALDIENYARRFTFPPPGKLTGEVHDRLKDEYRNLVTIGYGPDFSIIRSEGVEMDIPRLVKELQQEINAGVEGGGHLVVGSIKFIPAKRKDVLAKLASKIGEL